MTSSIKKGVLKISFDETFEGPKIREASDKISELLKKEFTQMVLDLSVHRAPDAGTMALIHALASEAATRGLRLSVVAASNECAYLLKFLRFHRHVDLAYAGVES
jgi:hypothetical protein